MPFTVEDGSGVPGANAYITVQEFRDHHADRGRDMTSLVDAQVQVSVVRATDYLDKRFSRRYRGVRLQKTQGLEWPRLDAYDDDDFLLADVDEIPRQLKKACAEYALRAFIYGELAPDPLRAAPAQDLSDPQDVTQSSSVVSGLLKSISQSIEGAVSESKTFLTSGELAAQLRSRTSGSSLVSGYNIPEYPEADMWMEELLKPANNRRLVRGS